MARPGAAATMYLTDYSRLYSSGLASVSVGKPGMATAARWRPPDGRGAARAGYPRRAMIDRPAPATAVLGRKSEGGGMARAGPGWPI